MVWFLKKCQDNSMKKIWSFQPMVLRNYISTCKDEVEPLLRICILLKINHRPKYKSQKVKTPGKKPRVNLHDHG